MNLLTLKVRWPYEIIYSRGHPAPLRVYHRTFFSNDKTIVVESVPQQSRCLVAVFRTGLCLCM